MEGHASDCPEYDVRTELVPVGDHAKALATIPAQTFQPDQASEYVKANVHRMPREFSIGVSYGRLFMGDQRHVAEGQMMNVIMQLLSYNYQVVIEKDDPMMRLVLKCTQQWRGGEEIEGPTMGKHFG